MSAGGLGGDERDRTADLLLAKQALSQLSYTPMITTNSKSEIPNPNVSDFEIRISNLHHWWAYLESNQGPHAYQACALTD